MHNLPPISIIIPTFNSAQTIEKTLLSAISQTYPNLELIVIDGKSSDDTMAKVTKYRTYLSQIISEPDQGISDAFNKGITHATGEYLYFLGSSDTFVHADALLNVMSQVKTKTILIAGQVERVTESGQLLGTFPGWFHRLLFFYKMALPHQGLLMHRSYFEKYGDFNLAYKYAMDYELLLRSFHHFPTVTFIRQPIAQWRAGGVGTGKIMQILDEYHRLRMAHLHYPKVLLQLIDQLTRFRYAATKRNE